MRVLTVLALIVIGYIFFFRPWHLQWGATRAEARMTLPGDEFVPKPRLRATHAITIHARPSEVWPWVVQIGQGRGGFYSYEWLENLIGCDIRNADVIRPEFQSLAVGDSIRLHPKMPGIPVGIVEADRALVLGETPAARAGHPVPMVASWGFYLRDEPRGGTRLIIRFQADWKPTIGNFIGYRVFLEPIHFMMEQKMLRGIKARVEQSARRKQETV